MSGIMMALLGASGGAVTLAIPDLNAFVIDPNDATVSLFMGTNGDMDWVENGFTTDNAWFTPEQTGIGSQYWVRLTVNSGITPSGDATGVWLALSAARSWAWTRTTVGSSSSNLTIAIATDSGGANIVASDGFTVSLTVNV